MNEEAPSQSDGADLLQLHLEPSSPIEVSELANALGALGRQYQIFGDCNLDKASSLAYGFGHRS
jgi:hypothetical protein